MVSYEVAVQVPADTAEAFEAYMRRKHIPEILATGCFQEARFERSPEGRFRTCYLAPDQEALDRYLRDHASAFRADFLAHFPEGCKVAREVWATVQTFR